MNTCPTHQNLCAAPMPPVELFLPGQCTSLRFLGILAMYNAVSWYVREKEMTKEVQASQLLGTDYEEFLAWKSAEWTGPFTIDRLLDSCLDPSHPWPPPADGVYLVSRKDWNTLPEPQCMPLYVGSNTGKSDRFCTRIGDLLADAFGFFGGETGHSSGGKSLHDYCVRHQVSPKSLWIAWVANCDCVRCAESFVHEHLGPQLNRKTPPKCKLHPAQKSFKAAFATTVGGG